MNRVLQYDTAVIVTHTATTDSYTKNHLRPHYAGSFDETRWILFFGCIR